MKFLILFAMWFLLGRETLARTGRKTGTHIGSPLRFARNDALPDLAEPRLPIHRAKAESVPTMF
jgi:hypothetical protein